MCVGMYVSALHTRAIVVFCACLSAHEHAKRVHVREGAGVCAGSRFAPKIAHTRTSAALSITARRTHTQTDLVGNVCDADVEEGQVHLEHIAHTNLQLLLHRPVVCAVSKS